MSRTLRLSVIATMLLATTALGTMAYKALYPPPEVETAQAPPPTPEPQIPHIKKSRPMRLWPMSPPDPYVGCVAEAKYAFNKSDDLTDADLHEYIERHPHCLETPVSMPMQQSASIAELRRREANLRQQIADCETLSRMETLTPPATRMTVAGTQAVMETKSRADPCWKYADLMKKALENDRPVLEAKK